MTRDVESLPSFVDPYLTASAETKPNELTLLSMSNEIKPTYNTNRSLTHLAHRFLGRDIISIIHSFSPPVRPLFRLSVRSSLPPSVPPLVRSSVRTLYLHQFVRPSLRQSVGRSSHLSRRPSVCPSVRPTVIPSVSPLELKRPSSHEFDSMTDAVLHLAAQHRRRFACTVSRM